MVCPKEHSMYTWEKCIFCYCCMECVIDFCQVYLVYSIVQIFCFFVHLLHSFSIHYWKWYIEISNYYSRVVCIYFQICQSSLNVFGTLLLGTIIFIIFIYSWWIDRFIIIKWPYLSLILICVLKSVLSIAILSCFGYCLHGISFSMWIYYMQNLIGLFLICSANLFLLIKIFNPFTFNIITDKVGFVSAILLFFKIYFLLR